MFNIFGNPVVRKEERRQRIEGEVEVLKKQQKVVIEGITKDYSVRETSTIDSINAQINSLKAQINSLNKAKEDKVAILREEMKVDIDKAINDFDRRIVNKQNKAKKLGYLIDADRKSEEDAINPSLPNAPKERNQMGFGPKILNEDVEDKKVSKKKGK